MTWRRLLPLLLLLASNSYALAEADTVRIAKQYGIGFVQLMIMEEKKLVEKHAAAAGLPNVKVEWATFRSSDVVNDALISSNLDFAGLGPTGIVTIWSRTRGSYDVKIASGLNAMAWMLNVRDPRIKSIRDFKETDRIAVPAVKVSGQAVALEIAAAKEWGLDHFDKLDTLTVSLAHPDATAMMLGGPNEIVASFSSPPYGFTQLRNANVRTLLTSDDIFGGPVSSAVMATTAKFRRENPKLYHAFLEALAEATTFVETDMSGAADIYKRIGNDPIAKDDLLKVMKDPTSHFTTDVLGIGQFTDFMAQVKRIRNPPKDWKEEMLFPEAQAHAK